MHDCLFCKMIRKEIKPKIEFEDESILAIHDINPQAPAHILLIPKKHIEKIADLKPEDSFLMGTLLLRAKEIAERNKFKDYRLVFNNGSEAGQTVYHIHMHLLSGRRMSWPPG